MYVFTSPVRDLSRARVIDYFPSKFDSLFLLLYLVCRNFEKAYYFLRKNKPAALQAKKYGGQKPAGLIVFDCRYFCFVAVVADFSDVFFQRVLDFLIGRIGHVFAYFPRLAYR